MNLKIDVLSINSDNAVSSLRAKITRVLEDIKSGKDGEDVLKNVVFLLGKTQLTIDGFRLALKGAIENYRKIC